MRVYAQDAMPESLIEAGRLDGANDIRIFLRIAPADARTRLITVFLFSLVSTWNNYFLPLVMLNNPKLYPVTVGLAQLNATANAEAVLRPSSRWWSPVHSLDHPAHHRVLVAPAFLAVRPQRRSGEVMALEGTRGRRVSHRHTPHPVGVRRIGRGEVVFIRLGQWHPYDSRYGRPGGRRRANAVITLSSQWVESSLSGYAASW